MYMLQENKSINITNAMQSLWYIMLPNYVYVGGDILTKLMPASAWASVPILRSAVRESTHFLGGNEPTKVVDLHTLLLYLCEDPDTKCAECSTSLFPEEVHWLEWWKFPYLQKEYSQQFPPSAIRGIPFDKLSVPHCRCPA